MKKAFLILMVTVAVTACLYGCSEKNAEPTVEPVSEEPVSEEPVSEEPSAEEDKEPTAEDHGGAEVAGEAGSLAESVNSFNRKLYESYGEEGNLFYSPFSIASALALTKLSAKGETEEEIRNVLSIEDEQAFLKEMQTLSEGERSEKAYFDSASALFIDSSLNLSPDYEKAFKEPAEEYFGGEFKTLDFRGDLSGAKKEIKDFVSDKTEGMISDYESSAGVDTVADILNAVYFYGEWEDKFDHSDTFKELFHGKAGDTDVEMMHKNRESFRYVSDMDGIKAVALPYSEGNYEMDVLVWADEEKEDYSALFKDGAEERVLKALDDAEKTELGTLAIPKFSMDLELDGLKEKLEGMGMKKAFTNEADFSLLAENLKITDISHRAKVEVDEEGSRAAAVTEIMMTLTSVMPEEKPQEDFIADRPFVFLIRDRRSGVILFTGRVNDIIEA